MPHPSLLVPYLGDAAWVDETDESTRVEPARRGYTLDDSIRAMDVPLDDISIVLPAVELGPFDGAGRSSNAPRRLPGPRVCTSPVGTDLIRSTPNASCRGEWMHGGAARSGRGIDPTDATAQW
jgi:hypothetical protein